ncbi:hypothetical protein [Streptomyces cinereoruber]|uniref:hypothetical protein n=1 Tax=Streptomyces cinereoruber TaxID=67260 RepID=UPI003652C423
MTIPIQAVSAANGVLTTAITIASEIGGKLNTRQVGLPSYNNFAPHYVDSSMSKSAKVSKWEISGAWFTHTRLYHLVEGISPLATGRNFTADGQYAEKDTRLLNQEAVNKSRIVATQYPFTIRFSVVSYQPRDRRRAIAETISSPHRGAAEYAISMQKAVELLKGKYKEARTKAQRNAIREEILKRERDYLKYTHALGETTHDMIEEIAVPEPVRHNIYNFRVVPQESIGLIRRYISAGISVEADILVGSSWGGDMIVELDWNERAFLDFAPFSGQICIGLNESGIPQVHGQGKFYNRFLATSTGLRVVGEADPNTAVNREVIELAAELLNPPSREEDQEREPVKAPERPQTDDLSVNPIIFWNHFAARQAHDEGKEILRATPVGGEVDIFYCPGSSYILIGGTMNSAYKAWEHVFGGKYVRGKITMVKHGFRGKVLVTMTADRKKVQEALRSVTDKQVAWQDQA